MLTRRPRTAAALLSLALTGAGCFSPTGQASTETSTGTTADTTGTTTGTASTSASTSTDPTTTADPTTSSATTTTSASTSTGGSDSSTGSTGPSTSTTTTVESTTRTTETDGAICGNGVVESGEECDDGNQDDTDDCTSDCTKAVCGDGFLLAGVEACDDGENNADDAPCTAECVVGVCGDGLVCPTCGNFGGEECESPAKDCNANCRFDYRLVFVTSGAWTAAALNGLVGADTICNQLVEGKDAFFGRTFAAWLSTDMDNALGRIGVSDVPYLRVDGKTVATSTADLVDLTPLVNPLNVDENGVEHMDINPVWTGTHADGKKNDGDTLCGDWTESDGQGRVGLKTKLNYEWTDYTYQDCDAPGHIYCIQTAP